VGIGQRLLDLARANLNALLDKAAGDARVEELTDEELEAELVRRKDKKQRELKAKAAANAAEAAARIRAAQRGTPPRPQQNRPPPKRPPAPPSAKERLAALYGTLETPVGADFETVRSNFRKLMRKYHPDMNAGSPEKLKAATEKAASITTAYQELETILTKKR
jgi:DnaJ-domain-containing protein 1